MSVGVKLYNSAYLFDSRHSASTWLTLTIRGDNARRNFTAKRVFENIWWERLFRMDDNGEWRGQIRDCMDNYVINDRIVRRFSQPTTILENMDNRRTWSQRRQTTS